MQTRISIGSTAIAVLVVLWSQPGLAQGNCGGIDFAADITQRFPNARNACLDVVEKDGEQFAHFQARIARVSGNSVEAEFKLPNGTWGRPVSFTPASDARVRIQGQTYRYRDLSRGQELDIYVPESRWAIAVQNDPAATFVASTLSIVQLEEPSPALASSLPRTASVLPLLGSAGALLTGFGFALAFLRRRVWGKS
jgi:hypothetical protein